MTFVFTNLIGQVRIALDQNRVELGVLASNEETLELDDIIRQKLMMSAKWLLERAPLDLIDETKNFGAVTQDGDGGVFTYPQDFLRIHTIKLKDWDIALHGSVSDDSEAAMTVHSDFAGIKPNVHRPLIVAHDRKFYCYPYGVVGVAKYIALPSVDSNTFVFPANLVDALIQLACSMTCDAYKEHDRAQYFRAQAMDSAMIQIPQSDKKR